MKSYLYSLCFMVAVVGITSCSKNNDPAPEPVVGSWKLDRIRTSGFVAPFSTVYPNGDNDPTLLDYQDTFTIKSDKTLTGTVRTSGRVIDYDGSWEFTNNTLTLKDDQGNSDDYTLDAAKSPAQLLGKAFAVSDSLTNPTTKKRELVKYNLQFVYSKQP